MESLKYTYLFGGGAIRGAAHVGVLKALQELGAEHDTLGGSSVGSIVAALYAVGYTTEELQEFIFDFARKYGYEFEHEATYERMCLVNDAVYIAKYADGAHEFELNTGEKILTPWTATGTQFAVPYVFKTLFANSPINFDDCCELKTSRSGPIYLDMNEGLPDVTEYEKEWKKLQKQFADGKVKEPDFLKRNSELISLINKGHNYVFVGNTGEFTPVKDGSCGGVLVCKRGDKYAAVTGTTGYRWLESEIARENGGLDIVDISYYRRLCDEAVNTINKYGDFDAFVSEEPYPRNLSRNIPF